LFDYATSYKRLVEHSVELYIDFLNNFPLFLEAQRQKKRQISLEENEPHQNGKLVPY
jgi:hypothetical protein